MTTQSLVPIDRFVALAVRQRMSLGVLCSTRADDFALVMAAAACAFATGRTFTEREVNAILSDWLASTGAMLDIDHVALRRWLVDTRVLERDGYGRAYARGDPAPDIARLARELEGKDLAAAAVSARAHADAERAERRRRWEAREQGAHD